MADGKQPQQSAESQKTRTSADAGAKAELLKKAQDKFAKTDVGSDGKDDSKDSEYRKLALSFVQKECLNLPDDRFQMLVEKITEVLKRKDVEKSGLETEFKHVRDEIAKDVSVKAPTSVPEVKTVPPESGKTDAKIGRLRSLGNALADKAGYDRELLRDNFEPGKVNVHNSANYLEFVATKGATEFMDDVRKNPDRFLGFCKNWGPNHPVYKELVSRGEPEVAQQIENIRMSFSANLGVEAYLKKTNPTQQETDAEKARLSKVLDLFNKESSFAKIRQKSQETALDKDSKVSASTEYLKTILDGKHDADLQTFARKLQSDTKMSMALVFDWNGSNPVYTALLAENTPESKKVLTFLDGVKIAVQNRVGLPLPGNSKEKRAAYENYLKQDIENAKKWEELDNKSSSVESTLMEKMRVLKELSKNGSEDQINKEKSALVKYVEQTVNPLVEYSNALLGTAHPGTNQYKLQQEIYTKLQGRRLAAEYLIGEDWGSGVWSKLSDKSLTFTTSGLNKEEEKKKREETFENNLKGKISFQTYSSKEKNHVKAFADFEREMMAADAKGQTFKELNSNDLFGYLKSAHAIGRLNAAYLVQIFPKTALQNAMYYGVRDGKIDRSFQGEAMKRLMSGTEQERGVAKAFQTSLLDIVNQQVSKEKIAKDGFPALKKYMEEHGNGAKFESVKAKLESAKDGMDNLQALMEAMGTSSKDPKAVDKFLNVDLPAISKTIGADMQGRIDANALACHTKYPVGMTVRESGITPLRLKITGKDSAFLEGIFVKKLEFLTLSEAQTLEKLVKSAMDKADKNKLNQATRDFLRDQLTPLEALVSMKGGQKQNDTIQVLAEGSKAQKKIYAAAILNPEDKKARKEAEAVVTTWVNAKEAARDAKLEEKIQKLDPDNGKAMNDVAVALGYGSLDDILSNDKNIVRAWNEINSHSEKYSKLPGYENIRTLLEKHFRATCLQKVHEGTFNEFYVNATKNESADTNKPTSEKNPNGTADERKYGRQSADTAENSAWSKRFFESESSAHEGTAFMEKVPVGEKVSISAGYVVERTATGVAFVTPDGKWKADGKAAEGAISIAKTLHESGADFLISSIGSLAVAEGIGYKDGSVSGDDERKLLVFMADFFGIKSFDRNEPDAEIMQAKFTRALSSEGRSLKEKGKDIGIVSESGGLIHSKLDERLATFNAYRSKTEEKPSERMAISA